MPFVRLLDITNPTRQMISIAYNPWTSNVTVSDINPSAGGTLYLQPGASVLIEAERLVVEPKRLGLVSQPIKREYSESEPAAGFDYVFDFVLG